MRIKKIIERHRRDFRAVYECEHCGYESGVEYGYDDAYFHDEVIPQKKCPQCGKCADESYRPLKTRYPEGMQV